MPRTTLNLDASVLMELKRRAKKQRKAMGDLANELLACQFESDRKARKWPPQGWITRSLGAQLVDVDLSSNAALWDFFDQEDRERLR